MDSTRGRELFVDESLVGERVDVALSRLLNVSRTRAGNMISAGLVRRNGATPQRSDRLALADVIAITDHDDEPVVEPGVHLDVVFVDDDVVVVNKPVGVAVHPSPGWQGPTMTGSLPRQGVTLAMVGPPERQGVVHRLDVGTSGVMVMARSPRAYAELKAQFKQRRTTKTYHALVQGHPHPPTGVIDAPIGRHPGHDYRFAVVAGGKSSVTAYTTLDSFKYGSLLELDLRTGRTHQIRVHMSALNHPCCGDLTYGADPVLAQRLGLDHQWLHARRLAFFHPATGEQVTFEAPYPTDLARALDVLRDQ